MLTQHEKNIYDALLTGILERKNEIITTPVTSQEINNIILALKYDNPQLYYVNYNEIRFLQTSTTSTICVPYLIDEIMQSNIDNRLEMVTSSIVQRAEGQLAKDATLYVHDWLVRHVKYSKYESIQNASHSVVGALLYSKCVCEGYAMAYKYLLDILKIRCIVTLGEAIHPDGTSGGHAWNIVKLNSNCYHVDVTFDSLIANQYCSRAYFLLSSTEISVDHILDKTVVFPDCPTGGNVLTTVSSTKELFYFLEKEYHAGTTHSEVRLTKGFEFNQLLSMIQNKALKMNIQWYNHVETYWYRDFSRTLFICWKPAKSSSFLSTFW